MTSENLIQGRRKKQKARPKRRALAAAMAAPRAGAAAAAYPGYVESDDDARTRTFLTGSFLLHAAGFAVLLFLASLAPVIEETIIPVQILREEVEPPPPPPKPASAPRALAERRNLPFAPAVQAVQPQIVNPHVIAEAAPVVAAETFQMEAVGTRAAPTEIRSQAVVVERVSAVNSAARAQVAAVDVARAAGPVVRGPTKVNVPAGPSVGPRKVEAAPVGTTVGTSPIAIGSGNGSSVQEGVISNRDVVGTPEGALVVAVDTSIGQGVFGGEAPNGTGTEPVSKKTCLNRPAVRTYVSGIKDRVYDRWVLPPGVDAGRKVKLRFRVDVAGSASSVTIVSTEDNALGASAVDALRSAAPFPPMPEPVRCLARVPIVGTFSNPVGG
ncbi:MAG: TonB family protein [Myxococcota bacterium]